jgi:predicted dehydrogenase
MHVSMNYFQGRMPNSLRWTIPEENFSNVVAIYGGHFLDALFAVVGRPRDFSSVMLNQFPTASIIETGETFTTTRPDQLVISGTLENGAALSVHIEGGKRNGSGVQIDITGTEGDLRVMNVSAFGDRGQDYLIEGARGDGLPLSALPVPNEYETLPLTDEPSSVTELGHLYAAIADDMAGSASKGSAPTFDDAVWMHRLIERLKQSADADRRIAA